MVAILVSVSSSALTSLQEPERRVGRIERYTGREVVRENIGMVSSEDGNGKEIGPLPFDWI